MLIRDLLVGRIVGRIKPRRLASPPRSFRQRSPPAEKLHLLSGVVDIVKSFRHDVGGAPPYGGPYAAGGAPPYGGPNAAGGVPPYGEWNDDCDYTDETPHE
ncbi:hypothetical protein niasHS_015766 [Heterodera schachtii]|uniref:Gland protein n=2 Tax=Heterodera TaxID=34509 RepID=A0ABD2I4W0_HETSC